MPGIALVLGLFASGCATSSPVQKVYDGPVRPDAELASVIVPYTIEISDINGTPWSSPMGARSSKEQRLVFLPGPHHFGFRFSSPYEFGLERSGVTTPHMEYNAMLEPGHTYRFATRVKGDDSSAEVDVWIEDTVTQARAAAAPSTPQANPEPKAATAEQPAADAVLPQTSSLEDLKTLWRQASPDERAEFLKSIVSP